LAIFSFIPRRDLARTPQPFKRSTPNVSTAKIGILPRGLRPRRIEHP